MGLYRHTAAGNMPPVTVPAAYRRRRLWNGDSAGYKTFQGAVESAYKQKAPDIQG
jgi:hypothetical protein